jgi:dihydroorotate dehydrogenase
MVRKILIYLLLQISSVNGTCPLYDMTKSFEENSKNSLSFHNTQQLPVIGDSEKRSFLGYQLASPIGIPACAIMTGKGIASAARRGFNVLTYKTVCSAHVHSYPSPNICYITCAEQLTQEDIGKTVYATTTMPEDVRSIAISNSLGNPSDDPAWVQHDIAYARSMLQAGQILIVSVFGQGSEIDAIAHDFAFTAQMAYAAGAHIIELNLSCPNVKHGFFYKNPDIVHTIVQSVHAVIPIPIILKVGVFDSKEQMKEIFQTAAAAGSRGICGINSVPVHVIDEQENPFFGIERATSGLSGAPIRNLARQFIIDAREIITTNNLDLALLATGGITSPEHFEEFLSLGADVALSGTGAMWDPYLAYRYHQKIY